MIHAFAAAGALSGLAVLYAFDPATTAFYPSCLFRLWTGLLCPLCGSLRAIHALLHGDAVSALRFNALGVVGGGLLVIAAALGQLSPACGERFGRLVASRGGWSITIVTVLLFAVARNIL